MRDLCLAGHPAKPVHSTIGRSSDVSTQRCRGSQRTRAAIRRQSFL